MPDGELAVGAGAVFQDIVDVIDLLAAAEFVDLRVDEFKELEDERACGTSSCLPKSMSLPSRP